MLKKYINITKNKLKRYQKLKHYYRFLSLGFFLLNTNNFILFNYTFYDKNADIIFKNYLQSMSSFSVFNIMLPTSLKLQHNIFKNKNNLNLFILFYLKFNILFKTCNYIFSFSTFIFEKDFINSFLSEDINNFIDFSYFKLTTHRKFVSFYYLQEFIQKFTFKSIYTKIIRILLFNKLSLFKVFTFKYNYKILDN